MLKFSSSSQNPVNTNLKQMTDSDLLDILCLKKTAFSDRYKLDPSRENAQTYKMIRDELFSRTPKSDMDYKKEMVGALLNHYAQNKQPPFLQTDEDKMEWIAFLSAPLTELVKLQFPDQPEARSQVDEQTNRRGQKVSVATCSRCSRIKS